LEHSEEKHLQLCVIKDFVQQRESHPVLENPLDSFPQTSEHLNLAHRQSPENQVNCAKQTTDVHQWLDVAQHGNVFLEIIVWIG
jgi:hypothetical protein